MIIVDRLPYYAINTTLDRREFREYLIDTNFSEVIFRCHQLDSLYSTTGRLGKLTETTMQVLRDYYFSLMYGKHKDISYVDAIGKGIETEEESLMLVALRFGLVDENSDPIFIPKNKKTFWDENFVGTPDFHFPNHMKDAWGDIKAALSWETYQKKLYDIVVKKQNSHNKYQMIGYLGLLLQHDPDAKRVIECTTLPNNPAWLQYKEANKHLRNYLPSDEDMANLEEQIASQQVYHSLGDQFANNGMPIEDLVFISGEYSIADTASRLAFKGELDLLKQQAKLWRSYLCEWHSQYTNIKDTIKKV